MLVLLFDIMEFGIVGGYLSKLCVTLQILLERYAYSEIGGTFILI